MPKLYGYTEILGDVLITGSFSILGSASTINSTNLTVEDSIIALSHGQTGSPVLDAGIFFVRGTGATQAFIWDESVDEFALVQTSDDHTVIGNINITGYSNLRLGNIGIGGAPSANTTAYIKGSGTSSGAYSLKIDDASNNNLFSILDNGQVNFNTTVDTWGTYNFTSTGGNVISVSSLSSGSYAGILFNTEGSARFFIDTNATGTRIRTQGTTNMYLARGVAEQEVLIFGPNYIQMEAPVGVGIGKYGPSVSARLHIQGSGTSSGTYSLKIDDGGGNPLLYVRNDGNATLVDATIGRGNGQILGNIAFGINSLFNNLTGYNNTAVGYYTLSSNTSGQDNTAFGTNALRTNSTGYENVAIGSALVSNTTGVYNVAVGSGALLSNSTGSNNVSVGKSALGSNTTASGNIGIGYRSLNDNTVGAVNVAIGGDAALFSQQGSGSIGLGFYAGQQSNGNNNIFIGTYAGAYLTASSNRLFIDNSNGRANVAGDEENGLITGLFSSSANSQYLRLNANVGVGITASSRLHIKGIDNTSSNYALKVESASASSILSVRNDGRVFIGKSIIANAPMEVGFGQDPYSTGYNTALGVNSLNSWNGAYSAGANIAVGYETLKNLTTGQYNVGVGYKALTNVVTGGYNTALNYSLISNLTGEYNVALGYGNLNVSTSSNTNIAIGRDNLFSFTSGTNNIAISGYAGLYNLVTGSNNIAIGYLSLAYVTSASFNTVIGNLSLNNDPFTGDNNTVIGASNLTSVTTGSNNTVIGRNIQSWTSSLSNNILIGDGSGNIRIMSDSTGNIGIGLTGPSYPLHVVGTVSSDAGYNIGATAGFTGTGAYTNFTIIGGIIVSAS